MTGIYTLWISVKIPAYRKADRKSLKFSAHKTDTELRKACRAVVLIRASKTKLSFVLMFFCRIYQSSSEWCFTFQGFKSEYALKQLVSVWGFFSPVTLHLADCHIALTRYLRSTGEDKALGKDAATGKESVSTFTFTLIFRHYPEYCNSFPIH